MSEIIIIGAGISGLSCAYFLKKNYRLFEEENHAGGLCSSYCKNGWTFDCSGHFLHIKDDNIKKFVKKLCNVNKINRNAQIYTVKKFIPYPFQANLFYLDEKRKKECVDSLLKVKTLNEISVKDSFLKWSNKMFGSGITKYFMKPYNQKLWDYNLNKMTAEWCGNFVPKPDIESIIKSAYSKNSKKYGYNSVFYYPKKGGCQALIDGFLKNVKTNFNSKIVKIDFQKKIVFCADGKEYKYSKLVSTQSLKELIKQITNVPKNILQAREKLIANSVQVINIGVKSKFGIPKVLEGKHWVYVPDKKSSFYRFGIYSNVNADSAPKNCYNFYVESSSFNGKYKSADSVLAALIKEGFISADDEICITDVIEIPTAYIIYDKNRQKALTEINNFLNKNDIYSIGRYGAWEYSFVEKNIKDAKILAQKINGNNL